MDRLVRSGYVTRQPCPEDRRVQWVELSDKGRAEFDEMARAHEAWLVELFDELSDEEVDELNRMMARMKQALKHRLTVAEVA
ncbi:MAG: hypothetical protein U5L11_12535 [Arhodomonas sp.]|nr:hypothetical protein [Arhodomonas sp.]